mgnify:CR=1 FL=1
MTTERTVQFLLVDDELIITTPHEHVRVNADDLKVLREFLAFGREGSCTLTLREDTTPV